MIIRTVYSNWLFNCIFNRHFPLSIWSISYCRGMKTHHHLGFSSCIVLDIACSIPIRLTIDWNFLDHNPHLTSLDFSCFYYLQKLFLHSNYPRSLHGSLPQDSRNLNDLRGLSLIMSRQVSPVASDHFSFTVGSSIQLIKARISQEPCLFVKHSPCLARSSRIWQHFAFSFMSSIWKDLSTRTFVH